MSPEYEQDDMELELESRKTKKVVRKNKSVLTYLIQCLPPRLTRRKSNGAIVEPSNSVFLIILIKQKRFKREIIYIKILLQIL